MTKETDNKQVVEEIGGASVATGLVLILSGLAFENEGVVGLGAGMAAIGLMIHALPAVVRWVDRKIKDKKYGKAGVDAA